jgi:hypothetical protein
MASGVAVGVVAVSGADVGTGTSCETGACTDTNGETDADASGTVAFIAVIAAPNSPPASPTPPSWHQATMPQCAMLSRSPGSA